MKNRIREVRNHYNLNQEEFGRRLGVSRGVIVNAELGRSKQNPLFFEHLCDVYCINRHWLEVGEGEMLIETESIKKILDKSGLSDLQKDIILKVVNLPPEIQQSFLNIMQSIIQKET